MINNANSEDENLTSKFSNGDKDTFKHVFSTYYPPLCFFASKILEARLFRRQQRFQRNQKALFLFLARRQHQKPWSVPLAAEKFLEYGRKCGLSENATWTYVSFLNNLKKYVESMDDPHIPCSDLHDGHIQDFLDYYFFEEEWTPRTYKNHAKFMSQFFSRVSKLEKKQNRSIKYEIDLSDLIIKKDRAEKNKYYSPVVKIFIKTEELIM